MRGGGGVPGVDEDGDEGVDPIFSQAAVPLVRGPVVPLHEEQLDLFAKTGGKLVANCSDSSRKSGIGL